MFGVVAGLGTYFTPFVLNNLGVDDVVDAIPVHGVCGTLGMLLTGLLSDVDYVAQVFPINSEQFSLGDLFLSQLIAVVVICGTSAFLGLITLTALRFTLGTRVSRDAEVAGTDFFYKLGVTPNNLLSHLRVQLEPSTKHAHNRSRASVQPLGLKIMDAAGTSPQAFPVHPLQFPCFVAPHP